ncbi:hypothetical protein PHAVU_002G181150 [Phaseolus vulgaris]
MIFPLFHSVSSCTPPSTTVALTPPLHCSVSSSSALHHRRCTLLLSSTFYRRRQCAALFLRLSLSFTTQSSAALVVFCSHILVFVFFLFSFQILSSSRLFVEFHLLLHKFRLDRFS